MAIDYNGACLLADTVKKGVNLGKVITIGHLDLSIAPQTEEDILRHANLTPTQAEGISGSQTVFADRLLIMMGASEVRALDASAYQGASLVHDLNNPISDSLKNVCDTVIDGGSLEHIFNVPAALANYMKLLKVGGHLIIHSPANNAYGHGLYQFSPELFFRSLSAANGFQIKWVLTHEITRGSQIYQVLDPADVGWRCDLVTALPAYIFVVAEKVTDVEPFKQWPQQADYQEKWDHYSAKSKPEVGKQPGKTSSVKIAAHLPHFIQYFLHRHISVKWLWRRTLDTGRCFKPWKLY